LGAVGIAHAANVSRKLDDRALQSQADPEEGILLLAGQANRMNHPGDSAYTKSSGNEDAIHPRELLSEGLIFHSLRLNPANIHPGLVGHPPMSQCLREAL